MLDKNKLKKFLAERIAHCQKYGSDNSEIIATTYAYIDTLINTGRFDMPTEIPSSCSHIGPHKIEYPNIPDKVMCLGCLFEQENAERWANRNDTVKINRIKK